MARRAEDVGGVADLDEFTEIHYRDLVADALGDRQVMCYVKIRKVMLTAQSAKQLENLRLHRDVERRGRFVEDDEAGIGCQRPGDSYMNSEEGYPFCVVPVDRIVAKNELCYAIRDLYPVTEGHTLVIPKRHVSDYFAPYQPERNAVHSLLDGERLRIQNTDQTVTGSTWVPIPERMRGRQSPTAIFISYPDGRVIWKTQEAESEASYLANRRIEA